MLLGGGSHVSDGTSLPLSAEWRDLVMLNYEVDPDLLRKHVPSGTALDSFEGKHSSAWWASGSSIPSSLALSPFPSTPILKR